MGLKADYEKVMSTSADQFKTAYATWFNDLKRKADQTNDIKAKKILLDESMAKSGFEKGKDFTSYIDWKKNLPKPASRASRLRPSPTATGHTVAPSP